MRSDAYKSSHGCGEGKEDLDNRVCWRKRLCKDCMNLRNKLYDALKQEGVQNDN